MIVLDTHAWLWWIAAPERLSAAAGDAIDRADEVGVSAISAWEVAMLVERGRVRLDRSPSRWVRAALTSDPRTVELPLTGAIAVRAAQLGADGMHGDPADRFIYATARAHDALLVTRDGALRSHDPERTVW